MSSNLPGNGLFAYGGTKSPFRTDVQITQNSRPESKASRQSDNSLAGSKKLVKLPPIPSNMNMSKTVSEFGHTPSQLGLSSRGEMSNVTNLTRDVEERVESKLLQILEKKVQILSKELEIEKAGKTQIEIEYKKLKCDFDELMDFKSLADNHVLRERELKRLFEQEVQKLKEERRSQENFIENLKLKISDLDKNYNHVQQDKNFKLTKCTDIQDTLQQQIKELEQNLEERDEIIEDLKFKLQTREEIALKTEQQAENQISELKNKRISENEQKMYKISNLIGEVTDLTQKNAEIEFSKKKYIDKNKVLLGENKNLMGIIDGLKVEIEDAKKDAKSMRLAKKNNMVVLEKKIIDLGNTIQKKDKEINKLQKEVNELKGSPGQQGGVNRYDNFEDIIEMPVKAKPMLFGDFDESTG